MGGHQTSTAELIAKRLSPVVPAPTELKRSRHVAGSAVADRQDTSVTKHIISEEVARPSGNHAILTKQSSMQKAKLASVENRAVLNREVMRKPIAKNLVSNSLASQHAGASVSAMSTISRDQIGKYSSPTTSATNVSVIYPVRIRESLLMPASAQSTQPSHLGTSSPSTSKTSAENNDSLVEPERKRMHPAHIRLQCSNGNKKGQQTSLTFSPLPRKEESHSEGGLPERRAQTNSEVILEDNNDEDDVFCYDIVRRPHGPNLIHQELKLHQLANQASNVPSRQPQSLGEPSANLNRSARLALQQKQSMNVPMQRQCVLNRPASRKEAMPMNSHSRHRQVEQFSPAHLNSSTSVPSGSRLGTTRRGITTALPVNNQLRAQQQLTSCFPTSSGPRLTLSSQQQLSGHRDTSARNLATTSHGCPTYVQQSTSRTDQHQFQAPSHSRNPVLFEQDSAVLKRPSSLLQQRNRPYPYEALPYDRSPNQQQQTQYLLQPTHERPSTSYGPAPAWRQEIRAAPWSHSVSGPLSSTDPLQGKIAMRRLFCTSVTATLTVSSLSLGQSGYIRPSSTETSNQWARAFSLKPGGVSMPSRQASRPLVNQDDHLHTVGMSRSLRYDSDGPRLPTASTVRQHKPLPSSSVQIRSRHTPSSSILSGSMGTGITTSPSRKITPLFCPPWEESRVRDAKFTPSPLEAFDKRDHGRFALRYEPIEEVDEEGEDNERVQKRWR